MKKMNLILLAVFGMVAVNANAATCDLTVSANKVSVDEYKFDYCSYDGDGAKKIGQSKEACMDELSRKAGGDPSKVANYSCEEENIGSKSCSGGYGVRTYGVTHLYQIEHLSAQNVIAKKCVKLSQCMMNAQSLDDIQEFRQLSQALQCQ